MKKRLIVAQQGFETVILIKVKRTILGLSARKFHFHNNATTTTTAATTATATT
jgi:hypothetical protein